MPTITFEHYIMIVCDVPLSYYILLVYLRFIASSMGPWAPQPYSTECLLYLLHDYLKIMCTPMKRCIIIYYIYKSGGVPMIWQGGGQEIFFFQIWKFAKPCDLLGGSRACSIETFFLNGAIWCVWVYMDQIFVFKKLPIPI